MNWHIWVRWPGGEWIKHASYVRIEDAQADYTAIDLPGLAAKALGNSDFIPRLARPRSCDDQAEGGGG